MVNTNLKILYVIPARGGSKGVPGKNIKPLAGKPLIYYSIEVARQLTTDENICVTTDDLMIKEAVEKTGLHVPFLRPENLSTDTATSNDVILHALNYYEQKGFFFDLIVLLQPTSPFRKLKDVENAFAMWTSNLDMVVSVKETKSNPYYLLVEEDEEGYLQKSKKGSFTRRQDCPTVYEYNGAVYLINVDSLKHKKISEFSKVKKVVMDENSSVDIDTPLDWIFAETLLGNNIVSLSSK